MLTFTFDSTISGNFGSASGIGMVINNSANIFGPGYVELFMLLYPGEVNIDIWALNTLLNMNSDPGNSKVTYIKVENPILSRLS